MFQSPLRRRHLLLERYPMEEMENRLLLSGGAMTSAATEAAKSKAVEALNLSSAVFVENQGQWADDSIKYAYNGQGINIGFTDTGPVLEVLRAGPATPAAGSGAVAALSQVATPARMDRARVAMSFDGAQTVTPVGVDRSPTAFNYLVGPASQHRSNVAGYQKISYPGLYQGIDLLTWGRRDGMKYEFHVAPNADWRNIRVSYSGSTGLSLDADGALHIATPLGDLVEAAPVLYQMVGGNRVAVAGQFVLLDADTYGFAVTGAYDPTRELVIDPDLAWATYLGGSGRDDSNAIAVDGAGNAYVTGYTTSAGWATAGAYDATYNGGNYDVFVAKLGASGSSLLYTTYLGGSGDDSGSGIAVDRAGNAYVTGRTLSSGWATAGAYDATYKAGFNTEAFVAKLSASGSSLLYATYLGGIGFGQGIAVDGAGFAYVTGLTQSAGWATAGAYDTTFNGNEDAFVAKLSASGSSLLYATYLGGSGDADLQKGGDAGFGIAVDGAGDAFVTGYTESAGWATAGAFDITFNGGIDAFVAKLSASGSSLLYATYLGGTAQDQGGGIAVDGAGIAYVTGLTKSDGWATAGAYDTTYNGGGDYYGDAFVAKLSASGSSLLYATYLGGSGDDLGIGIAVDGAGNAYVTGFTNSSGWATAGAYNDTYNAGTDAFVAKLDASGSSLLYATYLGGSDLDRGLGIAIDRAGNAYVTGDSRSDGWSTEGAYSTYNGGNFDAFVVKFSGLVDLPTLLPGDTNGDGRVDFQDLVAVAQNYGGSGKTRAQGDVSGDGNVDFQDLVLIAQNYGKSLPGAPIPSPAASFNGDLAAAFAPVGPKTTQVEPTELRSRPQPVQKSKPAPVIVRAMAAKAPAAVRATAPVVFSAKPIRRRRICDELFN